ncbi:MAG: DUF933 domain-containing protein [Phycisphaerales bacterium]
MRQGCEGTSSLTRPSRGLRARAVDGRWPRACARGWDVASEKAIKEKGRMRIEGKGYIMQDADVCHFLFNV